MTKTDDSISKRHNTNLWAEIRKLYESKTQPDYQRIKAILSAEFDLGKFPSERTVQRHAKDEGWKRHIPEDNIKAFNNTYTPEFWLCVRAVYESNPKLTYKRLRELVQNELQCDEFPSADAVNTKAKLEGWATLGKLREKSDGDLKKLKTSVKNLEVVVRQGRTTIVKNDKAYQDDDDDDGEIDPIDLLDFSAYDEFVESQKTRVKNLLMSSKIKQKKMSEVIVEARKRLSTINDIGDLLSDQIIMNHALMTAPEIISMDGAIAFVERQNKILTKTVMTYNELTFGRRESIKLELQMYGVGIEDLRVVDQDVRMKDLNDDTAFEEQKQRLIKQREEIAKRNAYINSGGLERDVEEEVKRRMMDLEGEEIDEGDFEDVE